MLSVDAATIAVGDGLTPNDVVDGIANLADKSMVTADISGNVTYYHLLELTRAYALERLLHPDIVYMHSSGVADTKTSNIAGVADRVWDYSRIVRSDQTVRPHGALALVLIG